MNIKQLEAFVRIVEHGSFAAAANSLHTTQSTVSARIKELEKYVGVDLFDRTYHRARLTAKGHELLPFAKQLVDFASSLDHQIGDPKALSGVVRLGVVGVVSNTWLPKLIAGLRERYPRLSVRIDMSLTRTLVERVREGQLDLAIIAGPMSDPGFRSESLGYDEFVWMASPKLAIPRSTLTPQELQRWPVLSLSEDSAHYPVIERWFREGGAVFRNAASCNNMNVVAALTVAGLGLSLLPRHCYKREIAAKQLRVLRTTPAIPRVEFRLISRSDRTQPLVASISELAKAVSELAQR